MRLKTKVLNFELASPLMAASGPLTSNLENLLFFNNNDTGALVTKTISTQKAKVYKPCIFADSTMVYNCETWSELSPEEWIEEILPQLTEKKKKPLMVSVGYQVEDFKELIPKLDPYADIFEISTHYAKEDIHSIVQTIKSTTDKPVFIKLSPHIQDYIEFVSEVIEAGGDGIVAINSVGPGLKISLTERRIQLGNDINEVWVSGPAIKPYALQRIYSLRKEFPELPLIAVGGIRNAEDVLEFMLAGANAVQMLSTSLIHGKSSYQRILDALPKTLEMYNFSSIDEVKQSSLQEVKRNHSTYPKVDHTRCIECQLCVDVCPVFAIEYHERIEINHMKCFQCGLCESRCPKKVISGGY